MTDRSWFSFGAERNGRAQIAIYSDIGEWGVSASDFRNQLTAVGKPSVLDIHITSNGGDVSTGMAIYNMLARHPARKVVTVDGLAASMASVVVMAGDEVIMPSNSMLMVHNPWGSVTGGGDQIASFGEALLKMRDDIADIYSKKSGVTRDTILALMDRETWLSAEEAVSLGLADKVVDPVEMAASVDVSKFAKAPRQFAKSKKPPTLAEIHDQAYERLNGRKPSVSAARRVIANSGNESKSLSYERIYQRFNSVKPIHETEARGYSRAVERYASIVSDDEQ